MKMEFGEDAENTDPSEELGLAARVGKKTKTQAKEKGEVDYCNNSWKRSITGQNSEFSLLNTKQCLKDFLFVPALLVSVSLNIVLCLKGQPVPNFLSVISGGSSVKIHKLQT